jgi:hypothetical protein
MSKTITGDNTAATMAARETIRDKARTTANAEMSAKPIRQSNESATANDVHIPLPPRRWK